MDRVLTSTFYNIHWIYQGIVLPRQSSRVPQQRAGHLAQDRRRILIHDYHVQFSDIADGSGFVQYFRIRWKRRYQLADNLCQHHPLWTLKPTYRYAVVHYWRDHGTDSCDSSHPKIPLGGRIDG